MRINRCSYCSESVDEKDFNDHAEIHFMQTRGKDAMGNEVPSQISVNFIPEVIPDDN
jgi:hypothetical protein